MRVELKMKFVQAWVDQHGRKRYRFRRKGYPRVELLVNGDPSSPEFQAAYHAALRGEATKQALAIVAARGGSGSVKDAIDRYLNSTTFNDEYSASTKALRLPSSTASAGSSATFRSRRWTATGSSAGLRLPRPRA